MRKTLQLHGRQIVYDESGEGTPFVLVHGSGANRSYWNQLAEHLKGKHVIQMDLYGHGETEKWLPAPYSYLEDVKLIQSITNTIQPQLNLIGHSSGGSFCLEFAAQNPQKVQSLVLAEPMLPTLLKDNDHINWQEVFQEYEKAHSHIENQKHEEAVETLFEYILGEGEWHRLPQKVQSVLIQNSHTLTSHSKASLNLEAQLEKYKTIQAPVLLIYGSETRSPFKEVVKILHHHIQNSQLIEIKGAKHNSPLSHAQKVNEVIIDYFSSHRILP